MIEERAGKFEVKVEEALPVAAGALTTAVVDGIVESVWASNPAYWSGKFPYLGVPPFPDNVPPLDDWLIGLIGPGAAALLGVIAKNRDLVNGGVGGLLYGVPRLIYSTVLRNLPQHIPQIPAFTPPPAAPSPNFVVRTASRYTIRG